MMFPLAFCHLKHMVLFQCFTRGFEYKKHQSDHKYEIMVSKNSCCSLVLHEPLFEHTSSCVTSSQTSDFPVLEPGWTAQEEMALLEAVMDCGFGNWWVVCHFVFCEQSVWLSFYFSHSLLSLCKVSGCFWHNLSFVAWGLKLCITVLTNSCCLF